MKYTPKELHENVNVSQTSPLKELFLLLGGALGLLIVIYIVLGFAVDLIVPRLPLESKDSSESFMPRGLPMKNKRLPGSISRNFWRILSRNSLKIR